MSQPNRAVDVLIIGAGAAGYVAATCAAAYGLNVRLIDKRSSKLQARHGDGINTRTMEILDSFELADDIIKRGHRMSHSHMWTREEDGNLVRQTVDTKFCFLPSYQRTIALSQARMIDTMLDYVTRSSNIQIECARNVESLAVEESDEYPGNVAIQIAAEASICTADQHNDNIHINDTPDLLDAARLEGSSKETIHAKYVVACDGTQSWTRQQLGISIYGDDVDIICGVLDVAPITDFRKIHGSPELTLSLTLICSERPA